MVVQDAWKAGQMETIWSQEFGWLGCHPCSVLRWYIQAVVRKLYGLVEVAPQIVDGECFVGNTVDIAVASLTDEHGAVVGKVGASMDGNKMLMGKTAVVGDQKLCFQNQKDD